MAASLDLEAYLERIQWSGPKRATWDTLAALLDAHMSRIPFENLDVLLGRPIRLDVGSLQDKLVRAGRGGYCFEHATLFAAVLEAFGFQPARHSARVVLYEPRTVSSRLHMFLTVPVGDEKFVVDPGFGLLAPRLPIPLVDDAEPGTHREAHRMIRDGDYWVLRTRRQDKTVDAWASTLEPDNPADFKVANHYTATHPDSPFVNRIMMRALVPDGFVTVMNRDVTVWRDNVPHSTQLADRSALRALLVEHFGFDLPDVEHLRVPSIPEWK
jgi:N-hydroxyarylamine O-acetyltransferase